MDAGGAKSRLAIEDGCTSHVPACRRRWPGIVLAILLWSFVIVLTIATIPSCFAMVGGRRLRRASLGPSVRRRVMLGVWLEGRLSKKPMLAGFVLLAGFVVALFAPPVTAAIDYGPEAATAAVFLAFLFGWGTINIFALIASANLRRQAGKVERFLSRFKESLYRQLARNPLRQAGRRGLPSCFHS